MVAFTWEVVELEVTMYRHKVRGVCLEEKVEA